MSIKIIFEPHSTTFDNEAHKSSGWNDIELSPLGEKQSRELFERRKDDNLTTIYTSDLQRAYKSVVYFRSLNIPIIKDKRLRECNYGDLTQKASEIVTKEKPLRIENPFPNGESYKDTSKRMLDFLNEIKEKHNDGDTIMIVGHRATQYGLNEHISGWTIEECLAENWKWQPGWIYELEK